MVFILEIIYDTFQEREDYINKLKEAEKKYPKARVLCLNLTEGYCCNIRTVLHRVIEWEGQTYYSSNDMGINYPFAAAKYHMAWKWTPGFNDYPLGEEFKHYNKVKIIQEWITGSDQNSND